MTQLINDPYFRVEVLSKTDRPNLHCYLALHQDYSESNVFDQLPSLSQLSESELGRRIVKHCIQYGHFGPLEHPSISFNCIGFPHSVISQARTHRISITFDVQSMRYTGERIVKVAKGLKFNTDGSLHKDSIDLFNSVFYVRPLGSYTDRQGNKYEWTQEYINYQCQKVHQSCLDYKNLRSHGVSEEHARDFLPYNFRQDFVVTLNARSLLHFCDMRTPSDAQLEIRTLANMMYDHFKLFMPEVADWYSKHRFGKNKLAP